jgi:hypothetical protein
MGEAQSASPVRPWLADHPSQFLLLERAVEGVWVIHFFVLGFLYPIDV